jgi:hypothetical protein
LFCNCSRYRRIVANVRGNIAFCAAGFGSARLPFLVALFASYMHLAMSPDFAAVRPEDLMRKPGMLIGAALTMTLFGVLTFIDLPWLNILTSSALIHIAH